MPYLTAARKLSLKRGWKHDTPGDLTYEIQQALEKYITERGLSYSVLAECLGSLEGAKFDLQERVLKPYEEKKRAENGDVWPAWMTSCADPIPTIQAAAVAPLPGADDLRARGWSGH